MPVRKYRSADEAEPLRAERLDPDNLRRVIDWSAFCRRLHPVRFPPGVFRYRTIEAAAAEREAWERA